MKEHNSTLKVVKYNRNKIAGREDIAAYPA